MSPVEALFAMFSFAPDRLFVLAIVTTLFTIDGVYLAYRQYAEGAITLRLFRTYMAGLAMGVALVWYGFAIEWMTL